MIIIFSTEKKKLFVEKQGFDGAKILPKKSILIDSFDCLRREEEKKKEKIDPSAHKTNKKKKKNTTTTLFLICIICWRTGNRV